MHEPTPDEYDSPWKDAVERYFPEFMAFYFPDAANLIDWSQAYTFLRTKGVRVIYDLVTESSVWPGLKASPSR